jgi:hypothetical protein
VPPARPAPIAAPKPMANRAPTTPSERTTPEASPETPPEAEERPQPKPAPRVPRVFVPPEVRRDASSPQTLIQPASPPELTPEDPRLPSFRVWTANLPKFRRTFVLPGQTTPPPPPATPLPPPPPPVVDIAQTPLLSQRTARLVLPPAPPPVFEEAPPQIATAPPPLPKGDAANVLSVNNRPLPLTDRLVVPPGNIVGASGDGTPLVTGPIPGLPPAPGSSSGASTDGRTGPGRGTSGDGASKGAGAPIPSPPGAPPANGLMPVGGARVIIRPADGNFDAVVVQTSGLDQFPEGKNLLSGKPIYTVYISLDTAKDWAMYFCIPGEKAPAADAGSNVLKLTQPAPVRAPYPTKMIRPPISLPSYQKYVLVHGLVGDNGQFRELRVVPPVRADTAQALIASLAGWVFRPATRDGVSVTVEFVISIPAAGL